MRTSIASYALLFGAMLFFFSCGSKNSQESMTRDKQDMSSVERHNLTPEDLWTFGRVSSPVLSPDGETLLFTIAYTDIQKNASLTDIYTMPVGGGEMRCLGVTKENEYEVAWRPDGKAICYLATKAEEPQIYEMPVGGGASRQITNIKGGIDGFIYSPDQKHILFVQRVKLDKDIHDLHPDMPLATARIETDLMYRHWNAWADGAYNHIFVQELDESGKATGEAKDIMEGEPYHAPQMPFGGVEEITWSPDGKTIAYTSKKLQGKASAFSTNSNIYLYSVESGETRCVTEFNKGYDKCPQYSADGSKLFWQSMEHDGYESDQDRIFVLDIVSGEYTNLFAGTELSVSSFTLDPKDADVIYFIADEKAKDAIFRMTVSTREITKVTNDVANYVSLSVSSKSNTLIAARQSMVMPTEIYTVDATTGESAQLSHINDALLSKVNACTVEERWVKTTDNKDMLVWVIYPPQFDKTKQYPALLYCQGGPQSTVSQFWSTRWNFALMAANDYIVVAPNRRGLPGFGKEWNEQISGDYGGQNMKDYLSAIDAVSAEPYVDSDRLGAVGASYGGFSIYWLAGHHEKRFKALISHCGIFNFDQMYVTTEESFFTNWDLKGAFWEKEHAAAMKSYKESPHLFVNNWDTPIMVIHGEKDFRIPYTQGMAAYNTAVMKGIPAEFLYFPDECHWVQKPQNSIVWHREFYKWLDRWLKK